MAARLFSIDGRPRKSRWAVTNPAAALDYFFAELESIPYANADASYRVAPLQRIGELEGESHPR